MLAESLRGSIMKRENNIEKRKPRTGMIKVLGLIHKREKQIDPRLAWVMFQKIYPMYRYINNK